MRYRVITSFSPTGWDLYGEAFVKTFRQFWPREVKLLCAWEGQAPTGVDGFDLLECDQAKAFFDRHADDPVIAGRAEHPEWQWGKKHHKNGYNFKFDAYKFAHKIFAIGAAARYMDDGKLYWIDADVRTHAAVTTKLLDDVLPDDVCVSYLPRPDYTHSECGFMGFNLCHIETRAFITEYEDLYATDKFLELETWHDSYVFDWLVRKRRPSSFLLEHGNSRAQPFDNSILGRYMTHFKGKRKDAVHQTETRQ